MPLIDRADDRSNRTATRIRFIYALGVPNPNTRWSIGLAAWIVRDGNYADFKVGDRAEFALEFYAAGEVQVVPDSNLRATHVHDVGLVAFHDGIVPDGIEPGQTVRANIGLGVDPFMYFERLSQWTRHRLLQQVVGRQ
jgi:hypothetical protein